MDILAHALYGVTCFSLTGLAGGRKVRRRGAHSLVSAGVIVILLGLFARRLVVPALAWPLHIIMDSFSHGDGRWQTLIFYPVSDWRYHGVNWWQHPNLILCYWGVFPVLWAGIFFWRWGSRGRSN
jgi:hypothetical protein